MKAGFFVLAVAAAGVAGCATDYVPPRPVGKPGPEYSDRENIARPGMFGDLRWNLDLGGKREPVRADSLAEYEEFKKWREAAGPSERTEFEEWRAWQEWKRKNPK